jgi:hypothetical protein
MNSAILSLLNGEYQELVLSFSTEGDVSRGVLQSPMDIQINYSCLFNTASAQEGAVECGSAGPSS